MHQVVINIKKLGKAYTVGHNKTKPERYNSLRDSLSRGVINLSKNLVKMLKGEQIVQGDELEEFWALKNINIKINKGERVGIIGRNGAGKSTLLKILSRITEPSTGSVFIKGRLSSLLEVGTGFHPELSGRENIFLNAAIMGMSLSEVRKKFNDIVEFAEVEKFIDTPVKRYSSGMYVKLAFSVAAHLEPEILVIDEVLAVGDVSFQTKCLNKMKEQQAAGKTILFVSHNLSTIREFCTRCILLQSGEVVFDGDTNIALNKYLNVMSHSKTNEFKNFIGPLSDYIKISEFKVSTTGNKNLSEIIFSASGECIKNIPSFRFSISLYRDSIRITTLHDFSEPKQLKKGFFNVEIKLPKKYLRPGDYHIGFGGHDGGIKTGGLNWLYLYPISAFSINEDWNSYNDKNAEGIVNLPSNGKRYYK